MAEIQVPGCAQCGLPIARRLDPTSAHHFCSQRCSAIFNNRRRATGRGSKRTPSLCMYCGSELSYRNQRYCNLTCQIGQKWQGARARIERGELDGFSSRLLKKYLLEVRGHRCESCGGERWLDRPIPLELDHIDGSADNHRLENLRLICPNCHALTPTYKSRNRGRGRHARRERYRAGKSY